MCDVWADQNDATLDGYNGKARRTDEAFPAKKGPPTMLPLKILKEAMIALEASLPSRSSCFHF